MPRMLHTKHKIIYNREITLQGLKTKKIQIEVETETEPVPLCINYMRVSANFGKF